ncbi:MAG: YggT family protein, partial [Candidatus Omnitrophota bacterium]
VKWLIIIRAIISWVNPDPFNPIVQFLYKTTEPILTPIRRVLRMRFSAIDLSPLIAIFILIFMQNFVVHTLMDLGARLR